MSDSQFIIVVVGLGATIVIGVLAVLASRGFKVAELAMETFGGALQLLHDRAEEVIVESVDLSTVHSILTMLHQYTDEPDDLAISRIANALHVDVADVLMVAGAIWKEAEDLTDGEVE